ncbi:MAG: sugar phosphate isomerase/epimerase [Chloroflexi bacterium]|nr:sugar phosphate isomerase/epimerase [Chloroflexota bacterium]MBV9596847.1 sugar phosphate isomerase/epimerase [Chloroflexota bacterium]
MNKLVNSPQNLGKTEPLAYIEATLRAGYEGIGIRTYRSPGRTYNFNPIVGTPDLERDVKNALKDSGLEVYDLYSFYLQPDMNWDVIKPALEFGGEIGCKYVLIIGDDPEWNRMVDSMGKMVDIIQPLGMRAAIEAFATALTPMTTCRKFVEDCKPRYVGMCLDPRQQFRDEKGFDSLEGIGRDQQLIPYVQLNDSAREGSAGILPGEGFVPLYAYLDQLPEDIDISVEAQIPPNNVYTGMEWAKISVERIRKYLARYRAARTETRSA